MLCKLLVLSVVLVVVSSTIIPNIVCNPVKQYPFTDGEDETFLRLSESVGYNKEKALKIIDEEYKNGPPAGFLETLQKFYEELDEYAKEEESYYNIGIKYLKAAIRNPKDKCVTYTSQELYKRMMLN